MPRFNCTSCFASVNAPDHLVGKQAKCPRCGVLLTVPALPEPPPFPPAAAVMPEPAGEYNETDGYVPLPAAPTRPAASRGLRRYPNLNRYLDILATSAQLVVALGLAASIFLLLAAAANRSVAGMVMSVGPAIAAGFTYLAIMASIEMTHVVLDIETNTRRTAESVADKSASE